MPPGKRSAFSQKAFSVVPHKSISNLISFSESGDKLQDEVVIKIVAPEPGYPVWTQAPCDLGQISWPISMLPFPQL